LVRDVTQVAADKPSIGASRAPLARVDVAKADLAIHAATTGEARCAGTLIDSFALG
jgi:hypothetical protein